MEPANLSQQEYIVRLWQRGLLSNAEAIRSLSDYCTRLTQQQARLEHTLYTVESLLVSQVSRHPVEQATLEQLQATFTPRC